MDISRLKELAGLQGYVAPSAVEYSTLFEKVRIWEHNEFKEFAKSQSKIVVTEVGDDTYFLKNTAKNIDEAKSNIKEFINLWFYGEPLHEDEEVWGLYIAEPGSDTYGLQFTDTSRSSVAQEYKDSWKDQYDDNNKRIKYKHKIVKLEKGKTPSTLNEESTEDDYSTAFSTLRDVTDAVDAGKKVFWKNSEYVVGKDLFGTYHVTYRPWSRKPDTVLLYYTDGRNSDYSPEDFYVTEGHTILPPIDRERYHERDGLEGPISLRSGKVVYYDPKAGKYYDPDSDFYMSDEEFKKHDTKEFVSEEYRKYHGIGHATVQPKTKRIETLKNHIEVATENSRTMPRDGDLYKSTVNQLEKWKKELSELTNSSVKESNENDDEGYYVEIYGGGRYGTVAHYATKKEAEEHVEKIKMSGRWSGMPPRVTKSKPLGRPMNGSNTVKEGKEYSSEKDVPYSDRTDAELKACIKELESKSGFGVKAELEKAKKALADRSVKESTDLDTVELTIPTQWVAALVNADSTGLEDDEEAALDEFEQWAISEYNLVSSSPIDYEDLGFKRHHDAWDFYPYAGDVARCTFQVSSGIHEATDKKNYEYEVQGNYEGEWECVDTVDDLGSARKSLKIYQENEKGTSFRIKKIRLKEGSEFFYNLENALNEDHGKGYYVCAGADKFWFKTEKEAKTEKDRLEKEGKKNVSVKKDVEDGPKEVEVKEELNYVDLEKSDKNSKVDVPREVKSDVNKRIKELNSAIDEFDGVVKNDNPKRVSIDCLEKIMELLNKKTLEGVKEAQVYYSSLMTPIINLFPPSLINFMANPKNFIRF